MSCATAAINKAMLAGFILSSFGPHGMRGMRSPRHKDQAFRQGRSRLWRAQLQGFRSERLEKCRLCHSPIPAAHACGLKDRVELRQSLDIGDRKETPAKPR